MTEIVFWILNAVLLASVFYYWYLIKTILKKHKEANNLLAQGEKNLHDTQVMLADLTRYSEEPYEIPYH